MFNYFFWKLVQDESYEAALSLANETAGRFRLFHQFNGGGEGALDVDSINQVFTVYISNLTSVIELLEELEG